MRVLTLKDGPHQVEPPAIPQLITLQAQGYRVAEMFGPALFVDGSEREVPDPEGGESFVVRDFDLKAIADHIAVLLQVTEPHAKWDSDKVAALMSIDHLKDYYAVLDALGDEGFGEDESPLASNATSHE